MIAQALEASVIPRSHAADGRAMLITESFSTISNCATEKTAKASHRLGSGPAAPFIRAPWVTRLKPSVLPTFYRLLTKSKSWRR